MKKTPHRQLMVRVSSNHFRLLDGERRDTGATLTWLVENAIMIAYGGRDSKRRRAK